MATINDPEDTLIMDMTHGRVIIQMMPDLAPQHVAASRSCAGRFL